MTRQQQWSRGALDKVVAAGGHGGEHAKKYATACRKTPSLLQRSGALQTVAFWMSRKDEPFRAFIGDLAQVFGGDPGTSASQLRERLQGAGVNDYLVLSRDLADVALWFRRMAQAELGEGDE